MVGDVYMNSRENNLIGDERTFSVRHRVLNIILLFSIILAVFTGIFNYVMNLGIVVVLLSVIGGVVAGALYYLSLWRKQYFPSAVLLIFLCILLFLPALWVYNGGIYGSTSYFIFLFSTMSTALVSGWKRCGVLLLIIISTLLLCAMEYWHPEWIIGYSSRAQQYADISFSLIINMIANAAFIALILNFYIKEQHRSRRYLAQIERHRLEIKFQNDLQRINEQLFREIEERKQAEKSLLQSEQLFAKTFAASPIPMFILSAVGRRFLDVNNSFAEVFGCSAPEVVFKSAASIIGCAELNQYLSQVISAKAGLHNVDITFYTKKEEKRMGLLSVEQAELNGEVCLLCTINDITERVQMLNEMARFDRLNLVGEMAASIAHEVRNPLTTVRGFLQLFQRKEDLAAQRPHIGIMIEELDRANSIVTEFLSLAKNKRIELVSHSLNAIITKLYPLLQADALASGKTIDLQLEEVPNFLLDENEIRQCILNLVRNGLEAVPVKGLVLIRTWAEADAVILAVQDNGAGIPPEVMAKFGTPFLTTKDKGTGLGIPICYRIAERHHAKIEINTGAKGTTFLLKFSQNTKAC
jgi:PAS domain S-box-containing protein